MIKLSVDGFTNPPPAGPTKVTVIPEPTPSPIAPTPSPSQDKQFRVQRTMWAFDGFHLLCTFTATAGDYIALNISSTNGDSNRPNDVWIVDLEITSVNHGKTFVEGTSFRQTISLNYSDTYNITIAKHPFYSTVIVTGTIDLHHNETTNSASNPTYSPSTNPSASPSPAVPEYPTVITLTIILIATTMAVVLHRKNSKL